MDVTEKVRREQITTKVQQNSRHYTQAIVWHGVISKQPFILLVSELHYLCSVEVTGKQSLNVSRKIDVVGPQNFVLVCCRVH